MRRRIRSATIPLHRHSLPQVAVDGVLVALAYWLAYRLRFDGPTGVPGRYDELFGDTFFPVVIGSVVIFAAFGLYGKWWRYVSQREYAAIVQAVVVAALALLRLHGDRQARDAQRPTASRRPSPRRPACSRCICCSC